MQLCRYLDVMLMNICGEKLSVRTFLVIPLKDMCHFMVPENILNSNASILLIKSCRVLWTLAYSLKINQICDARSYFYLLCIVGMCFSAEFRSLCVVTESHTVSRAWCVMRSSRSCCSGDPTKPDSACLDLWTVSGSLPLSERLHYAF